MSSDYYCDWTSVEKNTAQPTPKPKRSEKAPVRRNKSSRPVQPAGIEAIRRLANLLESNAETILSGAMVSMERNGGTAPGTANLDHDRRRLQGLFNLIVACVREQRLMPITSFIRDIANDRLPAGYDIGEMHTALNALEEATWQLIMKDMQSANVSYSLGSINTVLGVAKDALARTYDSINGKYES